MVRLSESFLARTDAARRARFEQVPDLDETLTALVQRGRSAWPGIALTAKDFIEHVADGLADAGDPVEALNATHVEDLYLACACARGDAAALDEFEKNFMSRVVEEIARRKISPELDDEARQRLRVRLLVAEGDARPRIASYDGRGPLGAWLFVAAARTAINLRQSDHSRDQADEFLQEIAGETDPELKYLKLRYSKDLDAALRSALATLSPREAAILRLTLEGDLTGDDLARMYRVSRRTIVNWLKDIRARVLEETQRVLSERLRLSASELNSLVGLVVSQISVSLQGDTSKSVK